MRVQYGGFQYAGYGNFRVAGLAQLGNAIAWPWAPMGAYEAQVPRQLRVVLGRRWDCSLRQERSSSLQTSAESPFAGPFNPEFRILQGHSRPTPPTVLGGAQIKVDPRAGTLRRLNSYAALANPPTALSRNGFSHDSPRQLFVSAPAEGERPPPPTFYDVNQIMHTICGRAKYDVLDQPRPFRGQPTYQRQKTFCPCPPGRTGLPAPTRAARRARASESAISFPDRLQACSARPDLYGGRYDLERLRPPGERLMSRPKHRPEPSACPRIGF